ncbi:allantoinase AllB [soil metagenome]
MQVDLAIKSKNIITSSEIIDGMVIISNGRIADVITSASYGEQPEAGLLDFPIEDVGDCVVMAGIIDPHVHINEPGRTDWEGFDTATKAAAAGGITTLVDMPLNSSPVTTTKNNFLLKLEAAKNKIHVNCGFWGGVVPGNEKELEELLHAGVLGLKAFLTHSGIDEFPNCNAEHLRYALKILKKYDKPLLVHCELDVVKDGEKMLRENPQSYPAWMHSRPSTMEEEAIKMMIDLCRETEARVHIVHLASANSIEQIQQAKAEGLPLTVETAQHYLYFDSESIPDGDTRFKCAPPIRDKANKEKLWEALGNGTIDFVATDHSPAPSDLKEISSGNLQQAWGGIAGLQFSLPALWTGALERNFSVTDISKWLCENPAKFLKMDAHKGKIAKGYDADFCIWMPANNFIVNEEKIRHRHKITPYLDQELYGVVKQTYLMGTKIFADEMFTNLNEGKIILEN